MKKIAILFFLLFVTTAAFSQKVVYHSTKYIQNGVESAMNPVDYTFEFKGNDIFVHAIPGYPPFHYRYDHHENGNAVYYQMATEYSNMTLVKNTDSWLVINPDKSVINAGSRTLNSSTVTVYKKGSGSRAIGDMYE